MAEAVTGPEAETKVPAEHHGGHHATAVKGGEEKTGSLGKYKWYLVGGLAVVAVLVFALTKKSNANASSGAATAATPTTTDGLDPNTVAALEQMGLLGNSSSGSSGYGGYGGGWWGGGGEAVNTGTSSTSSGSTSSTTGTTAGSTTGTATSSTTGSPLPGSSGGQLLYTTTGGETLAQIAASLGTTTESLISDTINGHGDVNGGKFNAFLSANNMGSKGDVPAGLKLYYTPSK